MKYTISRLLLFLALSAFFFCCGSDGEGPDDPEQPRPTETIEMKYLNVAGFVVGIPETMEQTDETLAILLRRIEHLSRSIPAKGLSLMTSDTIRVYVNNGDNRYIPSGEHDPYAGTVVIGDYKTHTSMRDSLLLWSYLSAFACERSLSAEAQTRLTGLYEKAKTGSYAEVYYHDGVKLLKEKFVNPPAVKSASAYLGEMLKACYAQHYYYPFVHEELERFDPEGLSFVESLFGEKEDTPNPHGITLPPDGFTQWVEIAGGAGLTKETPIDLWYGKYLMAYTGGETPGIPIVASRFVADSALVQCRHIIETMTGKLPASALRWMHDNHFRVGIIGAYEHVTDLPENRVMPIWWPEIDWNERGRGYGATPYLPLMTCGEENIIYTPESPFFYRYRYESIMVHEFAHNIDQGLRESDAYTPSGNEFETALFAAFANARATGLWKNTYSMENPAEYWAEGIQAWFNTCRMNVPAKEGGGMFGMHRRQQLKAYDPLLYDLIARYMPEEELMGYHFDFEP